MEVETIFFETKEDHEDEKSTRVVLPHFHAINKAVHEQCKV